VNQVNKNYMQVFLMDLLYRIGSNMIGKTTEENNLYDHFQIKYTLQ